VGLLFLFVHLNNSNETMARRVWAIMGASMRPSENTRGGCASTRIPPMNPELT
jgi:hypothetical protein